MEKVKYLMMELIFNKPKRIEKLYNGLTINCDYTLKYFKYTISKFSTSLRVDVWVIADTATRSALYIIFMYFIYRGEDIKKS